MRSVAGFIRGPDSGRRPGGAPRRRHGLRPWARRRRAACGRRASAPFFIRKRVQLAAMLLFRVAAGGRIRAAGPAALRAAATGFARGPAAGGRPAALPHPQPPRQNKSAPAREGKVRRFSVIGSAGPGGTWPAKNGGIRGGRQPAGIPPAPSAAPSPARPRSSHRSGAAPAAPHSPPDG